ncbi:MAG: ankyrin repeat domain-containing protein, partial [Wolbachia endosymbiont of Pissodes strobi]|nr:ankyrin repeat domain-containing protein [Wolbachia endosymbiont of Pissodes strobi]
AQRGDIELVESILKEEVDVNISNNKGLSPIYLAAEKGHLHVVKLLLKKGANYTPVFHLAIKSNNLELLKVLFTEKNGALLCRDTVINFPTLHNKYVVQREIADKRIKRHNNIVCIYIPISAIAVAAYIGLTATTISSAIIFATITGIFALIIAIMISEMSKRYIENEFQKKMFMELEECSSAVNDVEIEP